MKRTHARTQMLAGLVAMTGALGTVSVAQAQSNFVATRTTGITYTPLSSSATILSTNSDDGEYSITSPFPIAFYGATYTSLRVGDNGMIQFPDTGQQISFTNEAPGAGGQNNWIAPLWDDLRIYSNGSLSWEVTGTAPNRTLAVQWRNVSGCCIQGNIDVTFKVVFFEGSSMRIEVEYGTLNQFSRSFSATLAMEDSTGGQIINFTPTACGNTCDNAAVTGMSNTRVRIQDPRPDTTGRIVTIPRGALPGTLVTATVALSNLGTQTATSVRNELCVSADNVFDANDVCLWSNTIDLPPGDTTVTATATVPQVPAGDYFVFLVTDVFDIWVEPDEANNIVLAEQRFATAFDLSVVAVEAPTGVAPGASGTFTVDFENVGYAGPVAYNLVVSTDDTIDAMDNRIGPFVLNATGQPTFSDTRTVPFPALPANRYFIFAEVDPSNGIPEVDENNNSAVADNLLLNGPDFRVDNVQIDPSTVEVNVPLSVTADYLNDGVGFTGNVPVAFVISEDDMLDPGDQSIFNTFVFFPGNASTRQTITFNVPPLDVGAYTFFVVIDRNTNGGSDNAEVDEDNNEDSPSSTLQVDGADLLASDMTTVSPAFIGDSLSITMTVENDDVADARGFRYRYYLSENRIIRTTDLEIFTSDSATIAAGQSQTFTDSVPIPTLTSTASLFVGVILDIFSQVPERSESNNTRTSDVILTDGTDIGTAPIDFLLPIPDLAIRIVETPTVAAAGEDMAITRLLTNDGVAPATNFEYTYYLSTNPTISPADDIPIFTGSASLIEGQDDYGIDIVTLPPDIAPANYFVGAIIDPTDQIEEILEDNNTYTGPRIPVFPTTIQFATRELPDGIVGVQYEVGVYASGAPLALTFAIAEGNAPDGLTLDPNTGILSGEPTVEGVFEFTVRAQAGTAFADEQFVIRITAPTVEIQVATTSLPAGFVGREYSAQLVAVGGQVPYAWSVIGDLPAGLTLTEDGLLSGTPETPGVIPLVFQVRGDLGTQTTRQLNLNIISGTQALQIQQTLLFPAEVGVPYCDPEPVSFEVDNGVPDYSWSVIGDAPPGMNVSPEGNLCGTPTSAGSFSFTVRVQDSTGTFDTSLFVLVVDDGGGVAISTFSLPEGDVDAPYEDSDGSPVQLTAIEGTEPYTWSFVDGAGAVPEGLELTAGGTLTGTPTESGVFAFLVQVTDAQMRTDTQPLSLQINAPPAPPPVPEDSGCSCSASEEENMNTPWTSLAVMGALAAFFGLRRRKNLLSLLGALMIVGAAGSAQAQQFTRITGTPYSLKRESITYERLPRQGPNACTQLTTSCSGCSYTRQLPFPFRFYDVNETQVRITTNGNMGFGNNFPSTFGSRPLGNAGTPNAWIGGFSGQVMPNFSNMALLCFAEEGTAPNRRFIVEWQNVWRRFTSGGGFDMKFVLHEGLLHQIDIEYSAPLGTNAWPDTNMGMEDQTGSRPVFFAPSQCNTNCGQGDLEAVANTRLTFIQDPGVELLADEIQAPDFAFLNAVGIVPVIVTSLHGNPIDNITVVVEADRSDDFSNPVVIGTERNVTLAPFENGVVRVEVRPPNSFGEGPVFLRAIVDPDDVITEALEDNNTVASETVTRLITGGPDLAVERVTVLGGPSFNAGDTVQVVTELRNVGGEALTGTPVRVVLSSNPVISRQDIGVGMFNVTLAPSETVTTTTSVTIPVGTNSGTYYFGSLADPEDVLDELSDTNNGLATFDTFTVVGASLAITTTALPRATLRVPYVALLNAVGTAGEVTWTLTQGDLPTGLGLVSNTGEIFGRPIRAESQTFTVQVESGGETVSAEFTLTVVDPDEPLTIVTRAIPQAVVGQEYSFELLITGAGSQSDDITWDVTGLPEGFSITNDGIIIGTADAPGEFTIEVTVTAGGSTATRTISFRVLENPNLLIVPAVLSSATFDTPYTAQLQAQGGLPPYTWLIESGDLPDGIALGTNGELSGTPEEVGTFRFVVQARDSGAGPRSARDQNAFVLEVLDSGGFIISTQALPAATVDQAYDESIAAAGGQPPYDWTLDSGRVPEGLIGEVDPSTGEYRLRGQPTEIGITNLLLSVRDARGRTAQRAFALQVIEPTTGPIVSTDDDSGCTCSNSPASGAASAGLLALGLLGLAFIRRRS